MSVIERGLTGIKKVVGLVLPMFARRGDFAGLGPVAKLAIRFLVLALTLVALWWINGRLRLKAHLYPPRGLESLGSVWLPLLFLLASTFSWLVAWLWHQLGPERDESSFPDIERAWREAIQALDRSGLRLDELPLFLIIGRPQGPEGALFDGAELQLKVRGQPDRDDAPLRVYASREAIFVTCSGASTLGREASILGVSELEAPTPAEVFAPDSTAAEFLTLAAPGVGYESEASIMAGAQRAGRGPGQLLEEEIRALGRLAAERESALPEALGRPGLPNDSAEIGLQEARLRHLGRLIARDRRPYCAVNGILLLVPVAATNSDKSASRIGQLCRRDLEAIRLSIQVRCPIIALVCDMEGLPGFRELIERLPEDQKRRRMGQRFPFIPDVDYSTISASLESAIKWIAHKQLPARVDSLWRVEASTGLSMAEAVRGNVRLYQLLRQIRDRQTRLGRVFSRAVIGDEQRPPMLGGCYLAGTGSEPRAEQAFIAGVFRRLVECQDLVSWTPELVAQEARYARWTRVGYLSLAILVCLCAGLLIFILFSSRLATNGQPAAKPASTSYRPVEPRNISTLTSAVSPGLRATLAEPLVGGVALTLTTT